MAGLASSKMLTRWQEQRRHAESAWLRDWQLERREKEERLIHQPDEHNAAEKRNDLLRQQDDWEKEERENLLGKQKEVEKTEKAKFAPASSDENDERTKRPPDTDYCLIYGEPHEPPRLQPPALVQETMAFLDKANLRGHCTCRSEHYNEGTRNIISKAVGSAKYVVSILTSGQDQQQSEGKLRGWRPQYLWDVGVAQSVTVRQQARRTFVPVFWGVDQAELQLQDAIQADSPLYKMCELETLNVEDPEWQNELKAILSGRKRRLTEPENEAEEETAKVSDDEELHDTSNTPINDPQRKRYDFCILYDDEAPSKSKIMQLVENTAEKLNKLGWSGVLPFRDGTLGHNKLQQTSVLLHCSDLIICLLTTTTSGGLPPVLEHTVQMAFDAKVRQNKKEWIIPAFCYMDKREARSLVGPGTELASLENVYDFFITDESEDDAWIDKIKETLMAIPTSGPLKKLYPKFMEWWCSPMTRIQEKLKVEKKWQEHYMPPSFSAKEMTYGTVQSDSPVASMKTIQQVLLYCSAKKLVIAAGAGMGKSMLSLELTRMWCDEEGELAGFKLTFLIPLRLVSSHQAPLEYIICNDLKLMNLSAQRELHRTFKHDSAGLLFLIDGYDELTPLEQKDTTINALLKGDIAPEATVVVTTRPQCLGEIANKLQGTYVALDLEELQDGSVKEYVTNVCSPDGTSREKERVFQEVSSSVPREVLRVPLLMTMTCMIWKWNQDNVAGKKGPMKEIRTVSDVIGQMLGVYLNLKHEKQTRDEVPVFFSPSDGNIPKRMRRNFEKVAKMCYECIQQGEFIFSLKTLEKYDLDYLEDLHELGFLDVEKDSDDKVRSARCIHTQIQEYCAADYLAHNIEPLKELIARFDNQPCSMASTLGFLTNTLVFAVGIKADVLKEITHCRFHIPVVIPPHAGHRDLDISYEARLVHECSVKKMRDAFLTALAKAPLTRPMPLRQPPEVKLSAYTTLIKSLGLQRCLELLKSVHQQNMSLQKDGAGLQGVSGKRTITDTLLLSCLPAMSLTDTSGLLMYYASPQLLMHTQQLLGVHAQSSGEVQDPRLYDVTCSVQSLLLFLNHISRSRRFSQVTLDSGCRVLMDSSRPPSSIAPIEVGELWIRTTMSLVTVQELLKRLDVTRLILEWCELLPPDDKDVLVNLPGVKRVVLRWVCGARHLTSVKAPSVRSIRVIGWYSKEDRLTHKTLLDIFPAKTCSVEYDVSELQVFDEADQ